MGAFYDCLPGLNGHGYILTRRSAFIGASTKRFQAEDLNHVLAVIAFSSEVVKLDND